MRTGDAGRLWSPLVRGTLQQLHQVALDERLRDRNLTGLQRLIHRALDAGKVVTASVVTVRALHLMLGEVALLPGGEDFGSTVGSPLDPRNGLT